MGHGGERTTGKTWKWKKTMEREEYRKRFMERVGERWDEIIDAKIRSAVGFHTMDKDDEIVLNPPNPQSNKDITDQVMGRPQESIDHTSKGEKIQFKWE